MAFKKKYWLSISDTGLVTKSKCLIKSKIHAREIENVVRMIFNNLNQKVVC